MKGKYIKIILVFSALCLLLCAPAHSAEKPIKWIDFTPTQKALSDTLEYCIVSHEKGENISFSHTLAALASHYGGDFSLYKKSDLENLKKPKNQKLFNYYKAAYDAVLGGMVGEYTEYFADGKTKDSYGLICFSPIAQGYYYSHFDDFGISRSFGYRRRHLGHDLMGSVGTPIVAVEGGYVEALGWNMYGGWRVGIRSKDNKRYYYYAHLRRGHPYNDLYEGKEVFAGEVIGYLGMTGYSSTPDTNNINVPHLHYGMQVIFTPEQKDGYNQIWIDMYSLTNFLAKNKSTAIQTDDEHNSLSYRVPK